MNKLDNSVSPKKNVDFLICGTQKGGTTALDAYLREHPEVCMANQKEVHFFDNEDNFANGKPDYSKYHAFFSPKKEHIVLGESTPIYMYWNESPKRIFEYNSDIKLIIVLRNPIERAYSHWNMERSRRTDDLSFNDAINTETQRCRSALPNKHRIYSYVDRGHYLKQLKVIWKYFPKEQMLILKNEDLKHHHSDTLKRITDFLTISPFNSIKELDVHSRQYESKISPEEKKHLRSIFEPEIKELEAVLEWDCQAWLR